MTNIIEVNYQQTGESKKTNSFGMRDMQAKAFEKRNEQYLLLWAVFCFYTFTSQI